MRPNDLLTGAISMANAVPLDAHEELRSYIRELEAAVKEWVQTSAEILHTHSVDMGGRHGFVFRIPQGKRGDPPRDADAALRAIAAEIPEED